jgi:hypothetical protein
MKRSFFSVFILTSLFLSAASANNNALVKPVLNCTTMKPYDYSQWPGPNQPQPQPQARYLIAQVNEILRPKAFVLTVSLAKLRPPEPVDPNYPNWPSFPGSGAGGFGGGGSGSFPPSGGYGGVGGFYDVSVVSHQVARPQTSGVGKETAFVGKDFALRINLFKGPQGYPALLVEQRTKTRIQLYCQ